MKKLIIIYLIMQPFIIFGQNFLETINGVVKDANSGNFIQDANVILLDLIQTESTGIYGLFNYNVSNLNLTSNQQIKISIFKEGYKPYNKSIQPNGNGSIGEILLEKQNGIYVVIKDDLNDESIDNAFIASDLISKQIFITNGLYFLGNPNNIKKFFLHVTSEDNFYKPITTSVAL